MSLLCVYMNNRWLVSILHTTEHFDKFFNIIAFLKILIFKAPSLKPVVLTRSFALTQGTQILIDTTVILGNRHLIVVHNDDDARTKF